MKESDILKACLQYLKLKGIFHWRNNSGAYKTAKGGFVHFGLAGSPDIIAILPPNGKFLAIECKTAKGQLQPSQKAFRDAINRPWC